MHAVTNICHGASENIWTGEENNGLELELLIHLINHECIKSATQKGERNDLLKSCLTVLGEEGLASNSAGISGETVFYTISPKTIHLRAAQRHN